MREKLVTLVLTLVANAIGLVIAALVFEGFDLSFGSFLVVVAVFTLVLALATRLVDKVATDKAPALTGGVAIVATLVSLIVTAIALDGLSIDGIRTWIGATVLVWACTLLAAIVLPRVFLEKRRTA